MLGCYSRTGSLRRSALSLPAELLAFARPQPLRPFSRHLSTPSSPPLPKKAYYVTTPIFYVNANPHIGHLHSTLLADIYARFSRLRHPDAPKPILCTGTDEHGLKIQRVAEGKGISPRELCDGVSERFRDLAKEAGIGYDVFMRTTEERHKVAVEHVWRELNARGFIYKSSYEGWYAVSDEAYYSQGQVQEVTNEATGEKTMVSIETGTQVEWMEEENYKFRLSSFREPLLAWLSTTPHVLQPPSRSTALLASLLSSTSTDLQDLSISRPASRLSWGIPVPDDPDHTIYVWIDALVNYLTAAGYPWKGGEAFAEGAVWPPELMIVGKDIIRFHALYLPAVLMALSLPLPTNILAHGHWTMDKYKMSKSRGNVADPFEAMRTWGTDAMRAYLAKAGGNSASDADYSAEEIRRFYKKELAGTIGNLVTRVAAPSLLGKLEKPSDIYNLPPADAQDDALLQTLRELPQTFEAHMNSFDLHRAISSLLDLLSHTNKQLQLLSPWLSTSPPSVAHRALFLSTESLRITGILMRPFMPTKSEELLGLLGVEAGRRGWRDLGVGEGGERGMRKGEQLFPSVNVVEAKGVKEVKEKGKKVKKQRRVKVVEE